MNTGRRGFLSNCAAVLVGAQTLWPGGQRQSSPNGVPRIPDASGPAGPEDDPPFPPRTDPRAQLKESQKDLRRDADRLFDLAKDLKDEVYKTEQTDVLSLSLVHKAEDVEKLARQIKDLIRAS